MQYKHIKQSQNYEDYSSGRVLSGYSGATNFSVRLTQEIFERCLKYLEKQNNNGPYVIYDPFCGVAYTLTILGLFYSDKIKSIFASDINQESIKFAEKNLALLSEQGINRRIAEIESMISQYGKDSHRDALKSALHIKEQLKRSPAVKVFKGDILNKKPLTEVTQKIDMVISDIPYGNLTQWNKEVSSEINPVQKFLDNIKDILSPKSIVVISSNKKQELPHTGYEKVGAFKVGKRKIIFLTLAS